MFCFFFFIIVLQTLFLYLFFTACAFGIGGTAFGFLLKVLGGYLVDVRNETEWWNGLLVDPFF